MYVSARLFGLGIYVSLLFLFCIVIGKVKGKNVRKILILYAAILSLMGLFFVPNQQADLYRLREIMNYYAKMPFDVLINDYAATSNTPIVLVYYWVIGQFNIVGLLPMVTALIVYLNIFYIFGDYSEKHGLTGRALSLGLLIIMSNSSFLETISGIRTMLSFSIVLRCIYDELYNNKSIIRHILFYIIAALIHPISLIVVLLRFLFVLFQNNRSKRRKVFLAIVSVVTTLLFLLFGGEYISNAFQKGNNYISGDSYSYVWETIIMSLVFLSLLIVHLKCKRFENVEGDYGVALRNNCGFSRLIEMIMVLLCYEYNIYYRFGIFNLFLNIPIILYYTDKLSKDNNSSFRYLCIFYLCILILVCARGNLCALKFWGGV